MGKHESPVGEVTWSRLQNVERGFELRQWGSRPKDQATVCCQSGRVSSYWSLFWRAAIGQELGNVILWRQWERPEFGTEIPTIQSYKRTLSIPQGWAPSSPTSSFVSGATFGACSEDAEELRVFNQLKMLQASRPVGRPGQLGTCQACFQGCKKGAATNQMGPLAMVPEKETRGKGHGADNLGLGR